MWIFGLCAHTMSLGQLRRLGALTGLASGSQTEIRALLAGLLSNLPRSGKHGIKPGAEDPSRTYSMSCRRRNFNASRFSMSARTPDAPGNEPQLRRRQRDSALAAWERAKTLHDARQEEWQETLDQDHQLIYKHAVQRLRKIYEDTTHYIHQKAPRHQGKQTKQHKKDLVNQCRKAWAENHHRWEPHRSGFQCTACGSRMHQGLTAEILETRLQEDCPQMLIATSPLCTQRFCRRNKPEPSTSSRSWPSSLPSLNQESASLLRPQGT